MLKLTIFKNVLLFLLAVSVLEIRSAGRVEEDLASKFEILIQEENEKEANDHLFSGTAYGDIEAVKKALSMGANINAKDETGSTALLIAIHFLVHTEATEQSKYENIIKLLLEHDADVNIEVSNELTSTTALMILAQHGFTDMAKLLLDKKANVNFKRKNGFLGDTVLLMAIYSASPQMVKLLLDYGAHIDDKDKSGQTPLMRAAQMMMVTQIDENFPSIVRLLLNYGADPMIAPLGQDSFIDLTKKKPELKLIFKEYRQKVLTQIKETNFLIPDVSKISTEYATNEITPKSVVEEIGNV